MEIDTKKEFKLRGIASELNFLSRSDGSAIITQGWFEFCINFPAINYFLFSGGSICVAAVNGPLEVSPAYLDMNKAYIEVLYRPASGLPGVSERFKEKFVKSLCETCLITQLYPRTQISVQAQEMDDHGGVSWTL